MEAILRRFSVGRWLRNIGGFTALSLYVHWEHGKLTPVNIASSVAVGLVSAFIMAWAFPWASRIDTKLKRLVSRQ